MNQSEDDNNNCHSGKDNKKPVDSIQEESSQIQTDVTFLPVDKLPELPIITATNVNNQTLTEQTSTIIFDHSDNSPTMLQPNENISPQQLDLNDSYAIFSELSQLCHNKDGMVWKEVARYFLKFQNVLLIEFPINLDGLNMKKMSKKMVLDGQSLMYQR